MSWLAKSLASSFTMSDQGADQGRGETDSGHGATSEEEETGPSPRAVKDDISDLKQTLTRQFWGVASFLAPPPPSPSDSSAPDPSGHEDPKSPDGEEPPVIAGIRSDFAEIGGKVRSGFSRLSGNKAVSEISKIASTFLPFGADEFDEVNEDGDEDESATAPVGVTDEVLAFARNISMHPETWLDFPLFVDDEQSDDFDISDAQQDHALAVEHLAPRLAALRIELCPTHMSEACFWKIYFVLLYSRLNKKDAEILSTPQVVEARSRWLQELQSQTAPEQFRHKHAPDDRLSPSAGFRSLSISPRFQGAAAVPSTYIETEKHPLEVAEVEIVDKAVIQEGPRPFMAAGKDIKIDPPEVAILHGHGEEDDGDEWLHEDIGDMGQLGAAATIPFGHEEDVSFSDLEEEDDGRKAG